MIRTEKSLSAVLYNTLLNKVSLFNNIYLSITYGLGKNDVLRNCMSFLTTVRGRSEYINFTLSSEN